MKPFRIISLLLLVMAAAVSSCIYDYNPDLIGEEGYLIIEGDIAIGEVSTFSVRRSAHLDTWSTDGVFLSQLRVEANDGTVYMGSGFAGNMQVDLREADPSLQYRLVVEAMLPSAAEGANQELRRYVSSWSELVGVPSIDSLSFAINGEGTEISVRVSTHSAESCGYYRWTASETWEYRSDCYANYFYLPAGSSYKGTVLQEDSILPYEDGENLYYCWISAPRSQIMTGTTESLTEDRLVNHQLYTLAKSDWRISYVYSVDVRQTRITEEAYRYWQALMRNTTDVGGLFSPEPSELRGNIVNEADGNELVLGYVSVVKPVTERLFIDDRINRFYKDPSWTLLPEVVVPEKNEWNNLYKQGFVPTTMCDPEDPEHYVPGVDDKWNWRPVRCVDCRFKGGTKNKPEWWPTPEI